MRGAQRGSVKSRPAKYSTGTRGRAKLMAARAASRYRQLPPTGVNSVSVFQPPTGKEKKFVDTNTNTLITAGQATATGPVLLNPIAQGTDAIMHTGREITMTSVYWQFFLSLAATSAGSSPIRMLIVYDKQCNGVAPTIAQILAADQLNSPNNLDNRDRFITLVDEIVECCGTGGPQSFMRKGYRKISLPVVFNATTTATITAIQSGSVTAWFYQDGQIITANPVSNLYTRIRFDDA